MIVLGLNPGSHDSAACIVRDGVVVAAVEEERLTRRKHSMQQMPWNATRFCLDQVRIPLAGVDAIAICWATQGQSPNSVQFCDREHLRRHRAYYEQLFPADYFGTAPLRTVAHVSHHLAHAGAGYFTSPFSEAAIVVMDGQGEDAATTIAVGRGGAIRTLRQFGIGASLGYFYQAVTNFIGFGRFGGEGKTMGLAAYGRPVIEFPEFSLGPDGYTVAAANPTTTECLDEMVAFWSDRLERRATALTGLDVDRPRSFQSSADLAASAQSQLESVVLHLGRVAMNAAGTRNLVLSGGVALNCSCNGKLAAALKTPLWVSPVPHDAGAAIGAALCVSAELGVSSPQPYPTPFLGPDITARDAELALERAGLSYDICDAPAGVAADLIERGLSVAWARGKAEFGPRALGHRSILGDPRSTRVRDRINRVKRRAPWRPFSPAVLASAAPAYFEDAQASPFMLLALRVRADKRELLAGVTHADGTARPQTVADEFDPLYTQLLQDCQRAYGVPAVLNTSFNDEKEPMVCSAEDALRTFRTRPLDYLMLGPYLVRRP